MQSHFIQKNAGSIDIFAKKKHQAGAIVLHVHDAIVFLKSKMQSDCIYFLFFYLFRISRKDLVAA